MTRKDKYRKSRHLKISIVLMVFMITNIIFYNYFNNNFVKIKRDSMYPNLNNNQIRFIDSKTDTYEKGDIIVFNLNNKKLIKRIVATQGDIVSLKDNYLIINNEVKINDAIIHLDEKEYLICKNEYFVLGDNYNYSEDSRHFGKINIENIIGKIND